MRLIDAEGIKIKPEFMHDVCGMAMIRVEDIVRIINEQPTIQPKRGKWLKTARWGRVYYCDQCRNYLDFDGVNAGRGSTNFCPNCGAKMEVTE